MSIKERIKAPTPQFYKNLRNVGLIAAGIDTTPFAAGSSADYTPKAGTAAEAKFYLHIPIIAGINYL